MGQFVVGVGSDVGANGGRVVVEGFLCAEGFDEGVVAWGAGGDDFAAGTGFVSIYFGVGGDVTYSLANWMAREPVAVLPP